MLGEGDTAPDFDLRGYHDGEFGRFTLSEHTAAGKSVLLLFYFLDFSPVCTAEMCDVRDAGWYEYKTGLRLYAINRDGVYSHERFAEENDLGYPLLSDISGEVCADYDALFEEFDGMREVPRRSVFLVAPDRTVRYAWRTEDNYETPASDPIRTAIRRL